MVPTFLIQNTQNRDSRAVQLKLDVIIDAIEKADNKLIDIENDTDSVLDKAVEEIRKKKVDNS